MRGDFDSLVRCDLLAGPNSEMPTCSVVVLEYPQGRRVGSARAESRTAAGDWLTFRRFVVTGRFRPGTYYEFRFVGVPSGRRISYFDAARPRNTDAWLIEDGGVRRDRVLVCRVVGLKPRVDTRTWGCNTNLLRLRTGLRKPALARARAIGIGWLRDDFTSWGQVIRDSLAVTGCYRLCRDAGLDLLGLLCYGSPDESITSMPSAQRGRAEPDKFPPANLWADVFPSGSGRQNHWARYVERVMKMLAPVRCWEVWNEPNLSSLYFGSPDPRLYGSSADPIDTPRERCSLYVRMCYIARAVADSLTRLDGVPRQIIAGSVCGLADQWARSGLSPGGTWLRDMLAIARRQYGDPARCFDALSVHPYQHLKDGRTGKLVRIESALLRADIESARAVTMEGDNADRDVWITELGWPQSDRSGRRTSAWGSREENAANLSKAAVAAVTGSRLSRGVTGFLWYELTDRRDYGTPAEGFGLLDSTPALMGKPAFFAYQQVVRFVGHSRPARPSNQDRAGGAEVHAFDGVDGRRRWVAWRDTDAGIAELAAMTDSVSIESLAVSTRRAVAEHRVSEPTGRLRLVLSHKPVFVEEVGPRSRPDLVVDSVTVEPKEPRVGERLAIRAWVRNRRSAETRATPAGFPTRVALLAEGDTLGYETVTSPIGAGQSVRVEFVLARIDARRAGPNLLAAVANPGQAYVELDTDNNTRYCLLTVGR